MSILCCYSGLFIAGFDHILDFVLVSLSDFEYVNAGWNQIYSGEKHRTGYLFLLACLLDPHPMEGPIKSQFVCLFIRLSVCLSVSQHFSQEWIFSFFWFLLWW